MERHYGTEWPREEKVKHREMVAPDARYIFAYEAPTLSRNDEMGLITMNEHVGDVVGFAHYRFILEEELPVLYVYELQLEQHVQGKGVGKFLMHLLELIARKVEDSISHVCLSSLPSSSIFVKFQEIKKKGKGYVLFAYMT